MVDVAEPRHDARASTGRATPAVFLESEFEGLETVEPDSSSQKADTDTGDTKDSIDHVLEAVVHGKRACSDSALRRSCRSIEDALPRPRLVRRCAADTDIGRSQRLQEGDLRNGSRFSSIQTTPDEMVAKGRVLNEVIGTSSKVCRDTPQNELNTNLLKSKLEGMKKAATVSASRCVACEVDTPAACENEGSLESTTLRSCSPEPVPKSSVKTRPSALPRKTISTHKAPS